MGPSWSVTNQIPGEWVDPGLGPSATYAVTDGGRITAITLPSGFPGQFTVFANGADLGNVSASGSLSFAGSGVSSFTITGIGQSVNAAGDPFALQLGFNESSANLSISSSATFWSASVSGSWSDASKWTLGVPRADGAVVAITASAAAPATIPGPAGNTRHARPWLRHPGLGYTLSGAGSIS